MWFEISERIQTRVSQDELLGALESQFRKIASRVHRVGQSLEVSAVHATFGSINRTDTATVTAKKVNDCWLVVADVHYRPSLAFWIFIVILVFTWLGWLIPIAFYLSQKNTVKSAIVDCLDRVSKEFGHAPSVLSTITTTPISDIERLGSLKEKGLITEGEFSAKKKQLLGL